MTYDPFRNYDQWKMHSPYDDEPDVCEICEGTGEVASHLDHFGDHECEPCPDCDGQEEYTDDDIKSAMADEEYHRRKEDREL